MKRIKIGDLKALSIEVQDLNEKQVEKINGGGSVLPMRKPGPGERPPWPPKPPCD